MFYDLQNQACINTLCPTVQAKARTLLQTAEGQGIWVKLTCGYRSWASQAWVYAQGRFRPGQIITNAKPGYSLHQYKVAMDFVPADGQGGLHYEDENRIHQFAHLAKSQSWYWGGDFPGFKDEPHLEYLDGHTLAYFRSGGTI